MKNVSTLLSVRKPVAASVLAIVAMAIAAALSLPPAAIPSGWSLRGRVPVDDLRFEHHERSTYVTRGSLERSLSAAGM